MNPMQESIRTNLATIEDLVLGAEMSLNNSDTEALDDKLILIEVQVVEARRKIEQIVNEQAGAMA